jgi:hypothetical protein
MVNLAGEAIGIVFSAGDQILFQSQSVASIAHAQLQNFQKRRNK